MLLTMFPLCGSNNQQSEDISAFGGELSVWKTDKKNDGLVNNRDTKAGKESRLKVNIMYRQKDRKWCITGVLLTPFSATTGTTNKFKQSSQHIDKLTVHNLLMFTIQGMNGVEVYMESSWT